MAGPGGGPPRKSHTKSRKGCKTCKRRHIRCDENFPQCKNCTKHSCRCDYMDSPPPSDDLPKSPKGPNLLWTPSIEAEIDNWMRSGIYPFHELMLHNTHQFHSLSKIDRRLIHHVSSIYRDLKRSNMLQCTPWVEKLPIFLDTATGYDFVMSAILAFSATHLASETKAIETRNLAYHHRGVALNGLHTAIGKFSQETSEPILAASILLSWQASDWGGWMSLVQGISTVVSSMAEWKDNSPLALFVEHHVLLKPPSFMPPLSMGGGMMAPVMPEDDHSLQEAIQALQHLLGYLHNNALLRQFVEELLHSAQEIEMCSRTLREEQLFEKLQLLRMRLLWTPIALVQAADASSMNMLTVAHLYAVAMAVDASLPELNGAAFGALTTAPIDAVDQRIRFGPSQAQEMPLVIDELLQFPHRIAAKTRYDRGLIDHAAQADPLMPGQQSPYGLQNLHLDSGPTTPAFPPTFPLFAANISSEDLSVPPSPFLHSFVPSNSRRHSGLVESHSPRPASYLDQNSPRPNSMTFDHRSSFGGLGYGGDSPAYSPAAYSPAHSLYLEDDSSQLFGDISASWVEQPTGNLSFDQIPYDESEDKNKGHSIY